jgi:hypothetical protein
MAGRSPREGNKSRRPGKCNRKPGIAPLIPGNGAQNPVVLLHTSLYRVTGQVSIVVMQSPEKKIKIIRDKLSRIGIGEKGLDDNAILALYSINTCGNLCAAPGTPWSSSHLLRRE